MVARRSNPHPHPHIQDVPPPCNPPGLYKTGRNDDEHVKISKTDHYSLQDIDVNISSGLFRPKPFLKYADYARMGGI